MEWDDLLDAVETDTVTDSLFIGLLPRQFRDRAAGDWRRWLATFTTVVYKLGQPAPPLPATMAEQLCVGGLLHYTETAVVDLARDGWSTSSSPTTAWTWSCGSRSI